MSEKPVQAKKHSELNDKKKRHKAIYVTFPLWMLQGANTNNIDEIAFKIFCYAVYPAAKKLEMGTFERRIASASNYYGFHLGEFDRRIDKIIKTAEQLFDNLKPGYPMASIPVKKLIEFINFDELNYFEKSEMDVVSFLAYGSIRSILGKTLIRQTSKIVVVSRMAGYAKTVKENEIPDFLKKYLKRKQFDKLKWELRKSWNVEFYGMHTRGFNVSFDLDLKALIKIVEKNRKHYLLSHDKKEQWEAREQALKELNTKTE